MAFSPERAKALVAQLKKIPQRIPETRVFSAAAWTGPLATLTLGEWKKAGGNGATHLGMAGLCEIVGTTASQRLIERIPLIELVTCGWAGRVLERGMARFALENTEQLAEPLRVLAGMVTWEYDQQTGDCLYPVTPEVGLRFDRNLRLRGIAHGVTYKGGY